MRGLAIVAALVGVLGVAGYVAVADEPLTLENRVATLEALHGIDRSTPTDVPPATATSTATSEPTATDEPTATATNEPTATTTPDTTTDNRWHAPTDHEHGDAPPDWADAWSMAEFGHPVIYGGDEATPNENVYKHNAFKGWAFTKQGVDLYIRLHLQSNPHGRSGVWHSYEVYARDSSGAVSFWQGWVPFGEEVAGGGYTKARAWQDAGKQHFIVGAATDGQLEEWYMGNKFGPAPWSWDVVVWIRNPTTLYNAGESATAQDMTTWEVTGDSGTSRVMVHALYYIDGDANSRYPWRNNPGLRGWFCATPQGEITSTGSKACPAGELPQHVAPTMPALEGSTYISRNYGCPDCTLPN